MRTWLLGAKLKDPIYVVDPSTQETVAVQPTTFSALNFKERRKDYLRVLEAGITSGS